MSYAVYDRIGYSDKEHFSAPSDAQEYKDDNSNCHPNGNGIYNDYTVELKPKVYGAPFRFLCCECRNTKRLKFVILGALITLVLSVILIIVSLAVNKSASGSAPKPKEYGLIAYGPDENGKISFNPAEPATYASFLDILKSPLSAYKFHEHAKTDGYILCDENTANVPEGKVCILNLDQFGENCQETNLFSIDQGRPCILLVLKLEPNTVPVPFNLTGSQNLVVKEKLASNHSENSVGISCDGKNKADRDAMTGSIGNLRPVTYHPDSFPLYYFTQNRHHPKYVDPAVMVQFNTIPANRNVNILCTAWAENFNYGHPESSPVYSTTFTIYMHGHYN